MNYTVKYTNALENLVKTNETLWRLYSSHFKKYIIYALSLAIIFVSLGFLAKYTYYSKISGDVVYYNLNLSLSIGLAFLIVAIIYARHMIANKRAFFKLVDKRVAEHSLDPEDGLIEINDDSIKINGFNSKHEFRWKCFTHYTYKNGILFLMIDKNYSNPVAIVKEQMDAQEFDQFLGFVKSRFANR